MATRGYGAHEVVDTLLRAQTLNQQLGKAPDPLLLRARRSLRSTPVTYRKDLNLAISYSSWRITRMIRSCWSKVITCWGSRYAGRVPLHDHVFSWTRRCQATRLDAFGGAHRPLFTGPKRGCQCRLAFDLWCLSYPDQAQRAQHKGLARAQDLGHPFSLAYALIWGGMLHGDIGN